MLFPIRPCDIWRTAAVGHVVAAELAHAQQVHDDHVVGGAVRLLGHGWAGAHPGYTRGVDRIQAGKVT